MLITAIFLVFFFLLLLVLTLNANLLIEYKKSGKDDHFVLSFFILRGLIKYKFEIPMVRTGKRGIKVKGKKEAGRKEKDKGYFQKNVNYRAYLGKMRVYSPIVKYVERKFVIKELKIKIRIGTGDAFHTGLLSGALWGVLGILDSYISNRITVEKKNIKVRTNFSYREFKVDIYCIFRTKLVHIIIVAFRILLNYLVMKIKSRRKKGGKKHGGTSDSRTHDDSYGEHKRYG